MVRPGNLLQVRPEPIVATAEPELLGPPAELDMRVDLRNVAPRNANSAAAAQPGGNPPEHSGSVAPDAGTAQNRHDLQLLAGVALEREIVDLPAAPLVRVEQLMIEDVEPEVDRLGQFWPTFVRIISGTAVIAITMITTKYTRPRTFPSRPFVYWRMYVRSFATRKMGM
ncbi:MAG: hypothetical protein QOG93_984 [Gaiellaceae bacterium]|nr:hypothetical protein [Gaiellaceae bacterium]